MNSQTELSARQSLAKPGHALHRFFLKVMQFCEIVLPLGAMGFVGYQVFVGYYHSSLEDRHYLGVDFAIHSVLLIGLCWLIPYFILQKLKPSLEKAALKGLKKGVALALAAIETDVEAALEKLRTERRAIASEAEHIIECCTVDPQHDAVSHDERLARMLVD